MTSDVRDTVRPYVASASCDDATRVFNFRIFTLHLEFLLYIAPHASMYVRGVKPNRFLSLEWP